MKRQEHLFQFSGKQISEAAKAESEYHRNRLAYWRAEKELAVERAKSAGIEVTEYAVTGGTSVNVTVNPEVTRRISECTQKVNDHLRAADQFQIESASYGTQPERTYELHPDDIVYFRLAGSPRPE